MLGALVCSGASRAETSGAQAAAVSPATITSVAQFWQLSGSEKHQRHRVRIEFVVFYHDPHWQLLWGRNDGTCTFIRITTPTTAIATGRRILIEGSLVPANGFSIEQERVTILPEAEIISPLPASDDLQNAKRFESEFVALDGFVNRQFEADFNHLVLELAADTQPIFVRLMIDGSRPVPQLEGASIRLKGVYIPTLDAAGHLTQIDVWVARPEDIEVLSWLNRDARFARPVTSIDALPTVTSTTLVRIAGTVRAIVPGQSITIRDGTGQLLLKTTQAVEAKPGDRVEAVGYPVDGGIEWQLKHGLVRLQQATTPAADRQQGLPKLRVAEQVRELSAAEASRGYPVRLTGVVSWSHPSAAFFFIQDASGGIKVRQSGNGSRLPAISQRVTVTGVSIAGEFAPEIVATGIEQMDEIRLPEPQAVTLEQALTGVEEAQWVSMSGFVREISHDAGRPQLKLVTSGGTFDALLPPGDWETLRGSVVRLKGVCSATANTRRQLTGVQLWVGASEHVTVEEPAPANPFATTPLRTIASLREHNTLRAAARRVRVAGTVVDYTRGRKLRIVDGADSLLVFSHDEHPVALGDRIEVVGFPGRQSGSVVLREAIYQREGPGAEPAPLDLRPLTIDSDFEGQLVRLEGRLLEVAHHTGNVHLTIRSGDISFDALMEAELPPEIARDWQPGSHLALTGVYEIRHDEHLQPHGISLLLRTPRDVEVLARPSWWTAGRAWSVAGTLGLAGIAGFTWIVALRRQVRRQTDAIREQAEKSAKLERDLMRASRLESLGVLAGGIAHDFNNLLTVIMGNITLVLGDKHLDEESELCLRNGERAALRARDLTLQLLTFAKGGAPVRTTLDLPEIVSEAAQFALHGSNVRCEFDFAADLWPAEADKGQLSQVLHNLVINAKQAMTSGGVVMISLHNEEIPAGQASKPSAGRYVRVTVTDHGAGIGPEHLERVFEPYFTTKKHGSGLGLATVYSIIKRHGGHIEVQSTPGTGTTFRFWLPATSHRIVAPIGAPKPAQRKTGRILFMDDEEFVRQVAVTLLKRIGCHATAVDDGAAAVKEFAAAHEAGNPFHVVILDLTVPGGMGGAEAIAEMRRLDPGVRAIVSSGYSNDPVMANYEAYGFKAVVPKPYEADDLKQAIHRLLSEN